MSDNELRVSKNKGDAQSGASDARSGATGQPSLTQTTSFQSELKIQTDDSCDGDNTPSGDPLSRGSVATTIGTDECATEGVTSVTSVTVTKTTTDGIENVGYGDAPPDSGLSTVVEAWPRLTEQDRAIVVRTVRAFDQTRGEE